METERETEKAEKTQTGKQKVNSGDIAEQKGEKRRREKEAVEEWDSWVHEFEKGAQESNRVSSVEREQERLTRIMNALCEKIPWGLLDGWLPAGDTLHEETMTWNEAKEKAMALPGCLGFYHAGTPQLGFLGEGAKMIFKTSAEVARCDSTWSTWLKPHVTQEPCSPEERRLRSKALYDSVLIAQEHKVHQEWLREKHRQAKALLAIGDRVESLTETKGWKPREVLKGELGSIIEFNEDGNPLIIFNGVTGALLPYDVRVVRKAPAVKIEEDEEDAVKPNPTTSHPGGEITNGVKDEVKDEELHSGSEIDYCVAGVKVKLEPKVKHEPSEKFDPMTEIQKLKQEMKQEIKERVLEVKLEVNESMLADVTEQIHIKEWPQRKRKKEEVKVKQTIKQEMKQEVKDEVKEEMKEESDGEGSQSLGVADVKVTKKRKIQVKAPRENASKVIIKQELGHTIKVEMPSLIKAEQPTLPSPVKRSLVDSTSSYAARLPLWIKMCTDFKEKQLTWALTRPCCLPCMFILPYQPPDPKEKKSCYWMMTKKQKRVFRRWIDNLTPADEEKFLTPSRREFYLHPERPLAVQKGKDQKCRAGRQEKFHVREYEHQRELARRMWSGLWTYTEDGLKKSDRGDLCGSEIIEGVGIIKAPRKSLGGKLKCNATASPTRSKEVTFDERSGEWNVVWYMGTWREVKHFNILKYWPRGTYGGLDEVDRPLAIENALRAALEFWAAKEKAGQVRRPIIEEGRALIVPDKFRLGPDHAVEEGVRRNRQSGVLNISWNRQYEYWKVEYMAKDDRKKQIATTFGIQKHRAQGKKYEEACAAALEEAKMFRAKLVAKGLIRTSEEEAASRHRQYQLRSQMKGRIHMFEKNFKPKSSAQNIIWEPNKVMWKFQIQAGNKRVCLTTYPADPSQETISASYKELIAMVLKIKPGLLTQFENAHVIF